MDRYPASDEYPALDLRFQPAPRRTILQDLLYARLDDYSPLSIHDCAAEDRWRVFFRTGADRDAAAAAVAIEFSSRLQSIEPIDVPDEGWARRSQSNLRAIRAGRIVVAPPWDVPSADSGGGDVVIVIDPSTGFGTGHHATTHMCLELLQQLTVAEKRAIDIGTGSGVLAIAAWKLGATDVVAVDNDPDALRNARENIQRNGGASHIDVREADFATATIGPADIVMANLTAATIQAHASALTKLAAPGGCLIVSGFSPEEAPDVSAALGLTAERRGLAGEWTALILPTGT